MQKYKSMYEWVMARLAATKGEWVPIAEEAGVSIRTLRKIASREIKDPGVSHVERLARYYGERQEAHDPGWAYPKSRCKK